MIWKSSKNMEDQHEFEQIEQENNSGISYHGSGGGVLWTDRTAGVCGSIHDAGAGEGNRQHLFDYGCGSGLCGVSVGPSGRFLSGRDC